MLGAIIDDCPYPSSRSKNFGSNKEGPTIYHLPPNQQLPQKRSQTQADFWNNKMMGDLLDSPFGNNQGGVGFTTISLNDEENNNNNNAVVPTWPSDDSPITVRSGRRCSVLLFPTLLVLFTIVAAVFNHNSSGSTIVTSPEMPVSWDDDYEEKEESNNNNTTKDKKRIIKPEAQTSPHLFIQEGTFDNNKRSFRSNAKVEATSEILSLAKLYELPIVEVDKGILNTLCGNRPHQGFVLRCGGRDFEPMKRLPSPPLVAGAGKKKGPKLWLALDEVGSLTPGG